MATVYGEQQYHDSQIRGRDYFVVRTPPGALQLGVQIVLSAVLSDGRRITADNSIGINGHLNMQRSEVNELIDRMLGRDPQMRRPPVLAWKPLVAALESIGVITFESELIARPLEIRFEPSAERAVTPG